jgi:putative hydrolase of the HAD superfamily
MTARRAFTPQPVSLPAYQHGEQTMMRAVIFDMGGTLLKFVRPGNGTWRELEDRGIRGLYRYLIEQGHPLTAQEDAFVDAMFERLAEGWEQATGGHVNLRAVEWIAAGMSTDQLTLDASALLAAAHAYARPLREDIGVVPGTLPALEALRERGCRIGLISNTIWPAALHLEDLEQVGIGPYLDHAIFSGDAGMWKPTAQIFLSMLEALAVAPQDAVFIGDSPREDILGAQAVGMRAVWVRSREFPLGDVRPDAIVDDHTTLVETLDRL